MNRHRMLICATFAAALAVPFFVLPARTAPERKIAFADTAQPESLQSARIHALVGASFHAVSAGF